MEFVLKALNVLHAACTDQGPAAAPWHGAFIFSGGRIPGSQDVRSADLAAKSHL